MLPPLGTSFPLRRSFFVRLDVGEAGLLRGNVSCGAGAGRHHYPRLKGLWPSDMVSSLQNVAHRTAGWVGFPTETNGAARRWVAGDPTKLSPAFWRVPEHPQLWANRFRCLEVAAARLPWRARRQFEAPLRAIQSDPGRGICRLRPAGFRTHQRLFVRLAAHVAGSSDRSDAAKMNWRVDRGRGDQTLSGWR